jgi:hypothetical protein
MDVDNFCNFKFSLWLRLAFSKCLDLAIILLRHMKWIAFGCQKSFLLSKQYFWTLVPEVFSRRVCGRVFARLRLRQMGACQSDNARNKQDMLISRQIAADRAELAKEVRILLLGMAYFTLSRTFPKLYNMSDPNSRRIDFSSAGARSFVPLHACHSHAVLSLNMC